MVGRFSFHDYYTTDPVGALAFYTDVVGWHAKPPAGGKYTLLLGANGVPVAGVGALASDARLKGIKPYWVGTIVVPDVDSVVEVARSHGSKIYQEPSDIPGVGRFASVQDPFGASFIVSRPLAAVRARDGSVPGEFYWNELVTSDGTAALAFYKRLFEWDQIVRAPLSPGEYLTVGVDGVPVAGIHADRSFTGSGWLSYIQVPDLDLALERAKAKGATVTFGPSPTADGRVAHLVDPQGANFSMHENKK